MQKQISVEKMKVNKNIKKAIRSESGAVDSSFTTVIAIVLAAVLMFILPLMNMSEKTDNVVQIAVQTATEEFVVDVRTTGKLTEDSLTKYLLELNSTGNSYDVEISVDVLDENPGKKTAQVNGNKIGENITYSIYTSQIEGTLEKYGYMNFKEGDVITVKVRNTNTTISQMFVKVFYSVVGNEVSPVFASAAGVITVNGK